MTKKSNTLGLCKKAGKLISGFDSVIDELKKPKSKAAGIILASDVSEKTKKEAAFFADKYGVELFVIDDTMAEIQTVLNKKTGVFAILDEGLFRTLSDKN